MKILELRFKNLNSLYGEWHIDFTESEYAYNGIFALTGPTGAGKSTILDAICLALYGATPRLGRITQSSNDIMSRQTGECYAEVVFSSQAGRYRCHWAHHRSRKRADGELQIPRHEIAEATEEGKVLENKLTSVLNAVEEKTGMDFDRFTRSILLAQGGFDTFLKATVEQKSKILEQITGTKIYSDISIGVHERLREEKSILSTIEAETRGIPILSPEEEQEVREELTLAQLQENSLETIVSDLANALAWVTGIHRLEQELIDLAKEEEVLSEDMLLFLPQRKALDEATKAANLEGSYATLIELRKQQTEDQDSLHKETEALPAREIAATKGSENLEEAEAQTNLAKTAQQEAVPILKKVRALDQDIVQLTSSIDEYTTASAKDISSIGNAQGQKNIVAKKVSEAQDKYCAIETYFSEHAYDAELMYELTGIVEQIQALESKQTEVTNKEKDWEKSAANLALTENTLVTCKEVSVSVQERHSTLSQRITEKRKVLSSVLGEKSLSSFRAEKDALLLQLVYLHKIVELDAYRIKLEDGKACPLCGALEHPFAVGNIPVPDETEKRIDALTQIISVAEELETTIGNLVLEEREASRKLTDQKQLESDAHHAKEQAQSVYNSALSTLDEAKQAYADKKEGVSQKLKTYGIEEIPDDLASLLSSLSERRDTWLSMENSAKGIQTALSDMQGELQRLDGVIATHEAALQDKQDILKTLGKSFAELTDKRFELYGVNDPDSEESSLAKSVTDAEAKEKEARKACADLLQKVSTSKTRIESLQNSLIKRKVELDKKENLFVEELLAVGFLDEQQFLSVRLPLAKRNLLLLEAKALDDRYTALQTNQQDRTVRLHKEQSRNLTDKSLSELQPLFGEKERELKEAREAVTAYKTRLKVNEDAKKSREDKQGIMENQRKECAKWEKLHALIGSADGKKFRNFAQGLTFELMVGHANRQLAKMSDRYLLIRSEDQPLELNVIDNYQAGEVRSTKNLSGGESFIVSLTLALGLSKMASRKVRVDSLFLDEGFGTLDETSLETALKTLSSLQQDGKLIGVISHVSAMQEMISTQITITPTSGGRSILSGPGCRKIGKGC